MEKTLQEQVDIWKRAYLDMERRYNDLNVSFSRYEDQVKRDRKTYEAVRAERDRLLKENEEQRQTLLRWG